MTTLNNSLDFEVLAVGAAAVSLTTSRLERARTASRALVFVEDNDVRFRMDGVAPTATVGHPLSAGDSIMFEGPANLQRLQFIRQSADANVSVTYFFD
jgi:hypothetical protein